ncbi:MAG: hypothetical protein AAF823_09600 [Planctomycetota bacterium]
MGGELTSGAASDVQRARAILEEDLTFVWVDGGDAARPITATLRQRVTVVSRQASLFGGYNITAKAIVTGGTGVFMRYDADQNNFNSTIPDLIMGEEFTVGGGGTVTLNMELQTRTTYASAIAAFGGSEAFATWTIELPAGAAVLSESGHDYTSVLAIPEPAGLAAVGLAVVLGVRRRRMG